MKKRQTKTARVSGQIVGIIAQQLRHKRGDTYGEEIAQLARRVWDAMSSTEERRQSDIGEWSDIFYSQNWTKVIERILMRWEIAGLVRVDGTRYFLEPQTMEVEL